MFCVFLFTIPLHPHLTLFPYTTLFRSRVFQAAARFCHVSCPNRGGCYLTKCIDEGVLQGSEPNAAAVEGDRKSTRLNSSHVEISYAAFCLKKTSALLSSLLPTRPRNVLCFSFHDTATPASYTLSLHDALPISCLPGSRTILSRKLPESWGVLSYEMY